MRIVSMRTRHKYILKQLVTVNRAKRFVPGSVIDTL